MPRVENTPENRERCARAQVEGMELGDMMALAESALMFLYEGDQEYFEDHWEDSIEDLPRKE